MTGIFPFSYPVLLTVSSMILTAPLDSLYAYCYEAHLTVR
jgi:hypothetical protein